MSRQKQARGNRRNSLNGGARVSGHGNGSNLNKDHKDTKEFIKRLKEKGLL